MGRAWDRIELVTLGAFALLLLGVCRVVWFTTGRAKLAIRACEATGREWRDTAIDDAARRAVYGG